MPTRILMERIRTDKSPEQVREAVLSSYRCFGGAVQYTRDGFYYFYGKQGLPNKSTASLTSQFTLRKSEEGIYEVTCSIVWQMSEWAVACIVLGFICFPLWIVPILYFAFDPTQAYQYSLARVQSIIEPQPGLQLK